MSLIPFLSPSVWIALAATAAIAFGSGYWKGGQGPRADLETMRENDRERIRLQQVVADQRGREDDDKELALRTLREKLAETRRVANLTAERIEEDRKRLAAEKKAWDQMVSVMHTRFEDPA